MATVDTSIYSNLLRAPKTVAEYDAEAMAAQQSKLALQADRMKVDEYSRKVEGQNKLRGIVSSFGADRAANQNLLYKGGLLTEAEDYGKATVTQAKGQADAQKAKLEAAFKEVEYTGQLMSGIRDQASYTAAREKVARDLGPEAAAQIPEAYDPAAVEAFRVQATDIKTQLEQKWKQLDHTLNTDKFAYQKTNDAANRGVQIRGQNVAAASSRYSADKSADSAAKGRAQSAQQFDVREGRQREELDLKKTTGKAPTEFQGKSAIFGARAEEADRVLSGISGKFNPAAVNAKNAVEKTWVIGGALGAGVNKLMSANDQKAEQAQRDFINANLRQESGAAIGPDEFDNARKQYFPQPGDTQEVIKQKARNRKLAVEGLKRNAGKSAFSAPADVDVFSEADAILNGGK